MTVSWRCSSRKDGSSCDCVSGAGESAQIDTPITQVQLTRAGLYRIDVAPDGQATSLMVREGEANVWLGGTAQQALPGQTVSVNTADPTLVDIRNGVGVDEFDTWSAERDRRYEGNRSTPYVSRQMIGASDLDYFGQWNRIPTMARSGSRTQSMPIGHRIALDDGRRLGLTWVDACWG